MSKSSKNLTLTQLVLIILDAEFGFVNVVLAYFQMSYASLIWYAIGAFTFFIPLVIIVVEFSASIKNDSGGLYSWLTTTIGEKWAFIGTFVWLTCFLINLLQITSNEGINFSEFLFGTDTSKAWHLFGLNSTGIICLIAIFLLWLATYIDTHGVKKLAIFSSIGGLASIAIIIVFVIMSVIILALNHGQLAEPITAMSLIKSPNPAFRSDSAIMSFLVYAIFSFGGIESISGLIDKLPNPRKTFPKGVLIASILMFVLYLGCIFLCGFTVNWQQVLGHSNVNVVNVVYVLLNNLGVSLAHTVGWSAVTGLLIGHWIVHLSAFGLILNSVGVIFVLLYSPLKALIAGSSDDLWPHTINSFNKADMPANAMWIQFAILSVTELLIALSGNTGNNFFQTILDMNNVASVFPYYFLGVGFILFKKRHDLEHKLVLVHHKFMLYLMMLVMFIAMTFGVVMNLISPLLKGQYSTAFWSFVGPIILFALASAMYHYGIRFRAKRLIKENLEYRESQK